MQKAFHKNPWKPIKIQQTSTILQSLLFCTYIMNKYELYVQIYDIEKGTHELYVMLHFACLHSNDGCTEMTVCPEVFILEVGNNFFENDYIINQTKLTGK